MFFSYCCYCYCCFCICFTPSPTFFLSLSRVKRPFSTPSFSRRRVVIRKGHVAQRFYFIFSGSVCVTFDEDDYAAFNQPEDSDKSVLKKGDHFGVSQYYFRVLSSKALKSPLQRAVIRESGFYLNLKRKLAKRTRTSFWSFDWFCEHSANARAILLALVTCSFDAVLMLILNCRANKILYRAN